VAGAEAGAIKENVGPEMVIACAPCDGRAVPIACVQMMVRDVSLLTGR
jgi:hypothetical protein